MLNFASKDGPMVLWTLLRDTGNGLADPIKVPQVVGFKAAPQHAKAIHPRRLPCDDDALGRAASSWSRHRRISAAQTNAGLV
jgi:hypothetical protein